MSQWIIQMCGAAVLCLAILATFAGCDAGVTPVIGTDQPFTLFGLISPQLDTQKVIVFPVEGTLRMLPDEPLAATFTSEQGQETLVWRDSILHRPNGEIAHMFWSPFSAEYGRTYVLRVADSEGKESQADVAVPPSSEIEIQPPNMLSGVIIPVRILGDVPNLLKVELEYGFDYVQTTLGEKLESLTLPYDEQASRVEGGWLIRVNLTRDYRTILDFIRSQRSIDLRSGVKLRGIQLRFLAASAEWSPPGGVFDPEVLVQPGTMSNVTNGFGFVGAGYRSLRSWLPADSIATEAGFRQ